MNETESIIEKLYKRREMGSMDKFTFLDLIMEWLLIKDSNASFSETQIYRELGLKNSPEDNVNRQYISEALQLMVFGGQLKKVENRFGWFRRVTLELEPIDYLTASEEESDLWLPFGITDRVMIYPGLILFAGTPNSGKTAICLNIARENQNKGWNVNVFNSEMSATEFRVRLEKFPCPLDSWKINAYDRSSDFEDVVKNGKNDLNIIDYLAVYDEFYAVGGTLDKIAKATGDGITICCIQKNPHKDTGLGGYRTLEICRLALSLDYNKAKVIKAKAVRYPDLNPYMAYKKFEIRDGHNLTWEPTGDEWLRDKE